MMLRLYDLQSSETETMVVMGHVGNQPEHCLI